MSEGDELLTGEDVVRLLRLDHGRGKDPLRTLAYLRTSRQLGYLKVAGKVRYRLSDVEKYLERSRVPAL